MLFIAGLFAFSVLAIVNAFPITFFTMLFLGNIGIHWSFLTILPGAIALKFVHHSIFTINTKT